MAAGVGRSGRPCGGLDGSCTRLARSGSARSWRADFHLAGGRSCREGRQVLREKLPGRRVWALAVGARLAPPRGRRPCPLRPPRSARGWQAWPCRAPSRPPAQGASVDPARSDRQAARNRRCRDAAPSTRPNDGPANGSASTDRHHGRSRRSPSGAPCRILSYRCRAPGGRRSG